MIPLLLISASQPRVPTRLLDRCSMDQPVARFTMPDWLTEISGLADAGGGDVLAHADEAGRIAVIDPETGEIRREFRLEGDPREDFEGIAVTPFGIVLMTSTGTLFRLEQGGNGGEGGGGVVPYRRIETGFERTCELEGLAWDGGANVLLIPCKTFRDRRFEGHLVLFRWSAERRGPADPPRVTIPPEVLGRAAPRARLRATGVEWDATTGRILVLSSSPPGILELDAAGRLLTATPLDPRRHPQAEGLALVGRRLLVADEGARGRAPGTITSYDCGG